LLGCFWGENPKKKKTPASAIDAWEPSFMIFGVGWEDQWKKKVFFPVRKRIAKPDR